MNTKGKIRNMKFLEIYIIIDHDDDVLENDKSYKIKLFEHHKDYLERHFFHLNKKFI